MNRITKIVISVLIAVGILTLAEFNFVYGATIATTTTTDAFKCSQQDHIYYAQDYYWIVFSDGGDNVLYSSSDNSNWVYRGDLNAGYSSGSDTCAVIFSENYCYAISSWFGANSLWYERVVLNNDGTATFGTRTRQGTASTYWARDRIMNACLRNGGKPAFFSDQSFGGKLHTFDNNGDTANLEDSNRSALPRQQHNIIMGAKGFPGNDGGDILYFASRGHTNWNYSELWKKEYDDSTDSIVSAVEIANNDMFDQDAGEGILREQWDAVKDSAGLYHVIYIDKEGKLNHKTINIGDSVSTISSDVTGLTTHRKMTLSIADNDDLYLFYDKDDNKIYYRVCANSVWGSENILKTDATVLQGAFIASDEVNSNIALAWSEGALSPYNIKIEFISLAGPGNQPPIVNASASPITGEAPLTVQFTATAEDLDGVIASYSWDFGDGQTSIEQNPLYIYDSADTYTATLTVTDDGGATDSDSITITVAEVPNQPPVASISATPTSGEAPLEIQFTGSGLDSDGTITSYNWDFGDGQASTEQNPLYTYNNSNTYIATLTVTDDDGATDTDSITITVNERPNQPPIVNASANPITGEAPLTVQFTATAEDSDGVIVSYSWAFGDDSTSTQENPLHAYQSAGIYTAVLTVTDDDGATATDNLIITVTEGPSQPPENWWDGTFQCRRKLTVGAAPEGYSVKLRFDDTTTPQAQQMYSQSASMVKGDDFRIVYNGTEIDRDITSFTSSLIEVWFKVQTAIAGSPDNTSYILYYGNSASTAPPANKSNVYLWFDDLSTDTSSNYTIGRNVSYGWHGAGTCYPSYDAINEAIHADTGDNYTGDWKIIGLSEADVLAECDIRVTGSYPYDSTDAIALRWHDKSTFYTGQVAGGRYASPAIAKNKRSGYISGGTPSSNTFIPKDGSTHKIAFAAWGSNFKFWYDGNLMLTGTDSSNTTPGDVAFVRSQSIGWMDNLLVRRYQEPEPSTSSLDEETQSPPVGSIGPEGGEVFSPDGRIKIIIPAGALSQPTVISVQAADSDAFDQGCIPEEHELAIAGIFNPVGLVFNMPVQVVFYLDSPEIPGTEIALYLYHVLEDTFVSTGETSNISSDGTAVSFFVNHFSTYGALTSMISSGAPIGGGVQIPTPDLFTGAFTHNVAIEVPKGRRDMHPNLSLQYRTGNPNSWVGFGWQLNPGYIQRSTKHGLPTYNDQEDTFIFVSQSQATELVHLTDNLYQAKVEGSFIRYYKEVNDTWYILAKDGNVMYLGSTPSARQTTAQGTFAWYLTDALDTNGNYIEFNYEQHNGKAYPSQILYTGNDNTGTSPKYEVVFNLEDREDIYSSYISGEECTTSKRLDYIEVFCNSDLVWRYDLEYSYSSDTARSLLTSLTQKGSDGTSFPAQTFGYQGSRQ